MYVSSGIDFSSYSFLVIGLVSLGTLDSLSSLSFVGLSSFGSQLLESSSVFGISLFFLSVCFRFRRDNFFASHFYHNMINYTNNVRFIIYSKSDIQLISSLRDKCIEISEKKWNYQVYSLKIFLNCSFSFYQCLGYTFWVTSCSILCLRSLLSANSFQLLAL